MQKLLNKKKLSSSRWLSRHINDPYVRKKDQDGYRSRAAYKLIEMNTKYRLFKTKSYVVDLGSAPGGWAQVIANTVKEEGKIWAIDLLPMEPIEGVEFIKGDFTNLFPNIPDMSLNTVLSDMAPNFTGDHQTDHFRSMNLCANVLDFALAKLKNGGSMAMKIIVGGEEKELFRNIVPHFSCVHYFKPKASMTASSEIYIVALGRG